MKNIEMLLSFELVKENSILDYYNDKKIENQVRHEVLFVQISKTV